VDHCRADTVLAALSVVTAAAVDQSAFSVNIGPLLLSPGHRSSQVGVDHPRVCKLIGVSRP